MTERRVYDQALLDEVLARDGAELIGEYEKLTNKTKIQYKCNCSTQFEKSLLCLCLYGAKCKDCMKKIKGQKIGSKLKKSGDMNQDERNQYIISKINELLPLTEYNYTKLNWDGKMNSKITLICKIHNYEWDALVSNVLRLGSSCKKCGIERSTNKTRKDFISESKLKFGETKFDYSKVDYKRIHQYITLKCIEHNIEFTCIASEHLKGVSGGCSLCYKNNSSGENHSSSISLEEFKQRVNLVWGNRYSYDLSEFKCLNSTIKITCHIHKRTWESTATNHVHPTNPRGCIMCGREETGNKLRLSIDEILEKCKRVHNDQYTYNMVEYKNNMTNILVTCKIHGNFPISPAAHWKGYGCSICSQAGVSKAQLEWLNFIDNTSYQDIIYKGGKHNKEENFRFNSKLYRVDGYCKETKTIYEFLGCWYHGCPTCQDEEKIHCWKNISMKELYQEFLDRKHIFEENGYNVIYMWECKWATICKAIKKIQNIYRQRLINKVK
jgi:hypothetical protein